MMRDKETVTVDLSLEDDLVALIHAKVASGRYATPSEVFRRRCGCCKAQSRALRVGEL